ncbi:MAG: hypothetical protein ACON4B_02855 [Flavobacteriaceae bacterium]
MIYILLICCVVIVIISIKIFNNSKRNSEKERQDEKIRQELWKKQDRLAPLIRQKGEEDKELSTEKNIKCDDGITRTYKGFMYGIIKDHQESIKVNYISEVTHEIAVNFQIKMIELSELKEKIRLLTRRYTESLNDSEKDIIIKELETLRNRRIEVETTANADQYVEINTEAYITKEKWFSSEGKYLNVDEIIELNRKKNSLQVEYKERYEEINKLQMEKLMYGVLDDLSELNIKKDPIRIDPPRYFAAPLALINNHCFRYSDGNSMLLFSGTIDGVTYTNGSAVQNGTCKSQKTENSPPSKEHLKSKLNFNDLDEETKKSIQDRALFVDENGTIDENRGMGKTLANKVRYFIENINGINEKDISWDLTNKTKPENDIDGQWHFKNGLQLMKCFSEENFEFEMTNFLKQNNISKDSAKYEVGIEQTVLIAKELYKLENFTVEISHFENEHYKLVVLRENEIK